MAYFLDANGFIYVLRRIGFVFTEKCLASLVGLYAYGIHDFK
jgi:hypothetical protein